MCVCVCMCVCCYCSTPHITLIANSYLKIFYLVVFFLSTDNFIPKVRPEFRVILFIFGYYYLTPPSPFSNFVS